MGFLNITFNKLIIIKDQPQPYANQRTQTVIVTVKAIRGNIGSQISMVNGMYS